MFHEMKKKIPEMFHTHIKFITNVVHILFTSLSVLSRRFIAMTGGITSAAGTVDELISPVSCLNGLN
jgi:hypothetical protein